MSKFGKFLKKQREDKGYTRHQLAYMLGISEQMLGHLERGDRKPSDHVLKRLADALWMEEDAWYQAAGKIPPDVLAAVAKNPDQWKQIKGE